MIVSPGEKLPGYGKRYFEALTKEVIPFWLKFSIDESRTAAEIGAVTGLAWTAVGGTTLTVEAMAMPGKGEIKLTGKLGDVMKESALAALTYIRAHADKYGLQPEKFSSTDLHIHVPEGATPKDGPSAGITIATAILSALSDKPVRADVAMTGEITLRGKVLPIGGLKEKSLAARRVGIKTVLIPKGNERDIAELPEVVKNDLTFIPVSEVDEVFNLVFRNVDEETPKQSKPRKKRPPKAQPLPVVPESTTRESVRC